MIALFLSNERELIYLKSDKLQYNTVVLRWDDGMIILPSDGPMFTLIDWEQFGETVHRGAFCQFNFWWIYYCHSSKSTGKETGKSHLCAVGGSNCSLQNYFFTQFLAEFLSKLF